MKLLIIRHGDPDYENDTLTAKGRREASLLADRLAKLDIKHFYCSPMGRAKKTASYTLRKLGGRAAVCGWLREFDKTRIEDPYSGPGHLAWDLLPEHWTEEPLFYDKDKWYDVPYMKESGIEYAYKEVCAGLDRLLARHGYERYENYYLAKEPNTDTVALFCHFGVGCVLLSHLLGISPIPLWHGAVALTTSVTELCTEERREGKAYFRMNRFGDISHLYAGGEPASFSARFCEVYTDMSQRHD